MTSLLSRFHSLSVGHNLPRLASHRLSVARSVSTTTSLVDREKKPDPPKTESRWRRLKRERKAAPTPANRAKHQFDSSADHDLPTALAHVRAAKWAQFDETLELILRLNIDPRRADQNLRGVIPLPHGTGRTEKVLVFAEDDQARDALAAGADLVGSDDLIDEIKREKGKNISAIGACLSVPHLLPVAASKIGRILGPKGLMPSEKTGSVVTDVVSAIRDVKRGRLTYRTDRAGNMHLIVGKLSFADNLLLDNILTAVRSIMEVRPATVKKKYMIKAAICSSMGPSVKLDLRELIKKAMTQS